jgi:hypothetical protein
LFPVFSYFSLVFGVDDPKSEKLEVFFMTFSASHFLGHPLLDFSKANKK